MLKDNPKNLVNPALEPKRNAMQKPVGRLFAALQSIYTLNKGGIDCPEQLANDSPSTSPTYMSKKTAAYFCALILGFRDGIQKTI